MKTTILEIDNYVVKEGKFKEFQDWVKKNEKSFAALAKKWNGKYRGTYYYVLGTGAHVNAGVAIMWELSKYGDIDESLKLYKDPENERIMKEGMKLLVSTPTPALFLRPVGQGLFYKGT